MGVGTGVVEGSGVALGVAARAGAGYAVEQLCCKYPYGGGCGHYDAYKYDYDFAAFAVIFILLHFFGRFLLYNVVRDIITHNAEYINFCEPILQCGNYCHVSRLGVYYNMNYYAAREQYADVR